MTKWFQLGGIFPLDQARAVSNLGQKVNVMSTGFLSPRFVFSNVDYVRYESVDGVGIFRKYVRALVPERVLSPIFGDLRHWLIFEKLFEEYIKSEGKPDIIHAHNFLYAGALAYRVFRKYQIPFAVTEHSTAFARGLISRRGYRLVNAIAESASANFCVSENFRQLLQQKIRPEIWVVPNVVDDKCFEAGEIKARKKFTFLSVGSLEKKKDHATLVRAFGKAFTDDESVHLIIVGRGPLKKNIQRLLVALNLQTKATIVDELPRVCVLRLMKSADCFVLPSAVETFGVVAAEALACGLPVIATRSGGPESFISEDQGVLVNVGDTNAMMHALKKIKSGEITWSRESLVTYARDKFGEKAVGGQLLKHYCSILDVDCYGLSCE